MITAEQQLKLQNFFATQPVKKAYVFGSYARNEEVAGSDLDVLVELDELAKVSLFDFANMKLKLSNDLKLEIDLLSDKGLSKYIAPYIHEEKRLIYERKTG